MMMKRAVSFVLFGLGTAVLFGCPIYSGDRDQRVCVGEGCYGCPDSYYSDRCSSWTCSTNLDCPSGYACSSDKRCALTASTTPCTKPTDCATGNCGADNACHASDCSATGCPASFVCKLASGVASCVPADAIKDGGSTSCGSDADCPSPAGSKCLTGSCVAPENQCADATQCTGGSQCVQGACTPTCSKNSPCPTGYACDEAKGVCTGANPSPCTSSAQCSSGAVCVQQHCVAACGTGETCSAGLKCVDGGCTPDQNPVFACTPESGCQKGSICLRHSCYIACDADAGADACKNADKFNQCKSVTTSAGTYSVCGSTTNLGTECDPTQNKNCASPLVCIDGYCK